MSIHHNALRDKTNTAREPFIRVAAEAFIGPQFCIRVLLTLQAVGSRRATAGLPRQNSLIFLLGRRGIVPRLDVCA